MRKDAKIYVAGHGGMVGSALMRRLSAHGYTNILTHSHSELDLTRQSDVEAFFAREKPEYVFLLSARSAGVADNRDHLFEALYVNTMITTNVIKAAYDNKVEKLLYTGSASVYPEFAPQPIKEESLLEGKPEYAYGGYALAKTVGIKLCEYLYRQYGKENFIAINPPSLYGDSASGSNVMPMLVSKFRQAVENNEPSVTVWGTGNARREFLHCEDLVNAMVFLVERYNGVGCFNVGSGKDISIRELAELLKSISGFKGEIIYDTTKPEGAMQRLLDSSKLLNLGWKPQINLDEGLRMTYNDYVKNKEKYRN
jgi:GDP-L-fucose synthase